MNVQIPQTMRVAAIDRFGGPEVLKSRELPVPRPGHDQVLIRLESAGVGVWDADIRRGELELAKTGFPFVLGNDGAGTIVAVGKDVTRVKVGDRVYAFAYEGGFYAEYVVVKQESVSLAPPNLPTEQAGALGADGITALIGLEDKLRLRKGESLLIFGASGGIGHLAVQLAKRMGARVLAVASGKDGVELVSRLGADTAVEGRNGDVAEAVRAFAPQGIDAALILASSDSLDQAMAGVKQGGRIAFPNGVEPEPKGPPGVQMISYDGTLGPNTFERLNGWVAAAPFRVELGRTFRLEDAATAHREIAKHHLGKLALIIAGA